MLNNHDDDIVYFLSMEIISNYYSFLISSICLKDGKVKCQLAKNAMSLSFYPQAYVFIGFVKK